MLHGVGNIYHQNDHFGVGKYSSTMEHLGMLNYHFGCRIMVSQRVIFGSRDARFPIYWVPVLSMWGPPSYKMVYKPHEYDSYGYHKAYSYWSYEPT
jgi:hypothetical protein